MILFGGLALLTVALTVAALILLWPPAPNRHRRQVDP